MSALEFWLQNETQRHVFKKYCASEFAVESVLFVEQVQQFRQLKNAQELHSRAQELNDNFLVRGAIFELNLDAKAKHGIVRIQNYFLTRHCFSGL